MNPPPPALQSSATAERELRLRLATDALGVGVFEVAGEVPVWENDCMYQIFGRDPARGPIGPQEFVESVLHPDDHPSLTAAFDSAIAEGRTLTVPCRIRRQNDGVWRWIEFTCHPGTDAQGNTRVVGVVADVTERYQATERLRESEQRHRTLAQALQLHQARLETALHAGHLGAWQWDVGRGTAQWSDGLYEITGLTQQHGDEPIERFLQLVPDDDLPQVQQNMQRLVEHGEFPPIEHRIRRADGQLRWVHSSGRALRDDEGRVRTIVGVLADVTEQKQLELALREQSRRKDEFLAMLGHELRNPLAPVVTAASALKRGVAPERAQRLYDVIERQSLQLTHLVNDLLDASRLTTGRIQIRPREVWAADVVRSAVEALEPELQRRGQQLELQHHGEARALQADPARLSQVLVNLLHNASKFSPDGGRIELHVNEQPQQLVVQVRDQGCGMAPELLTQVFGLFVQGPESAHRTRGGLGIGLALVQRLAQMHGGDVQAHSDGPGRGAVFTLRLPRDARAA